MSAVIELLQDLVQIPSVNPQGDPGTIHIGEGAIAQFVGDYLLSLGMEVELQFVEKDRPNVIGRLKSKTSRCHILLGPHLDTVGVAGMAIDPFAATLRDGKIWGRGACDTKGSIAMMLTALSFLISENWRLENTDIWFAGLIGEESGNDGIVYLMESDFFPKKGVKINFGIAGEPTDLKIVHRHKGALWLRIRIHGRSCHAAVAETGENAILKIRRAMDYVALDLPKAYAHLEDPLLGKSSFHLTTVRGGTKVNIIPDLCEIEVDHRSLPQELHSEIVERVKKALPECEVEVISDRPGLNTPPDNPYIQKLCSVLSKQSSNTQLPSSFLTGAPWFGDCSLMAKDGIPSIAFGPGSIHQAHTKDEFIEVASLESGAKIFVEFLRALD